MLSRGLCMMQVAASRSHLLEDDCAEGASLYPNPVSTDDAGSLPFLMASLSKAAEECK